MLDFCEEATIATYINMAEYNRRAVNGEVVTKVSKSIGLSLSLVEPRDIYVLDLLQIQPGVAPRLLRVRQRPRALSGPAFRELCNGTIGDYPDCDPDSMSINRCARLPHRTMITLKCWSTQVMQN